MQHRGACCLAKNFALLRERHQELYELQTKFRLGGTYRGLYKFFLGGYLGIYYKSVLISNPQP